ncbi:hypothetical protein CGJ66_24515, partial [Vibrio parahaemolyticus]
NKLVLLALSRAGFMTSLDIELINLFQASHEKIDEESYSDDTTYLEALRNQAIADGLLARVNNEDELLLEIIYCLLKA